MLALTSFFEAIRGFIELGGDVLWAIMAVLLVMWTLILERYWYFFRVLPTRRREVVAAWRRGGSARTAVRGMPVASRKN